MTITLRPYQTHDVAAIRASFGGGARAVCYVAPTGSGKTVLFTHIASELAKKGRRAWMLVHRHELLTQTSKALTAFDVPHGLVSPLFPMQPEKPLQVASVQTLVRRLDKFLPPDLIIADECHHAVGATWATILRAHPAKILGVTATPQRLDGRGLKEIFDAMVIGPSVADLIVDGYLAQVKVFAPPQAVDMSGVHTRAGDYAIEEIEDRMDRPVVTGDAVEHYRRICPGVPAIAFCVSVDHAKHVAEQFSEAGFRSTSVDGSLGDVARKCRINGVADGSVQVLTSCELISEGLDIPTVTAAILLRPTQSLGMCRQQIGRVLRPAPGKAHAIVLDHVGNTLRHGLPTDEIAWTLEGDAKAKNGDKAAPVKVCPECFCCHKPAPHCPECGCVYAVIGRRVDHVDGELEEVSSITRDLEKADRARRINAARTLPQLRALAVEFGYAPGWAWYVFQSRGGHGMRNFKP